MNLKRLDRGFYNHPTLAVAKALLGKYLLKDEMLGRIVETEAYLGLRDLASHANWKNKETCFPMWKVGEFSYVYLTYGMYYMFNISTERAGKPSAVLIRALEPVSNIIGDTNGPGRLTRALAINKSHNDLDLVKSDKLFLAEDLEDLSIFKVVRAKRIGVDYAGDYKDKLWRFYISGNKYVSRLVK